MSTDTNYQPPAYAPPTPTAHRQTPRVIVSVLVGAGVIIAAAGGFLAGRATAPEATGSKSGTGTTSIVTATVTPDVTATTVADPNADLLSQALTLHQAGKIDEASALYQEILTKDPNNKYALFNLGQIAHTKKDYATAIERYNAALVVDPQFVSALYNGGLAYASNGDRANAIALLTKLIQIEPNNAPALFNLGTVLIADGKADEGSAYLEKAYQVDPSLKPAA